MPPAMAPPSVGAMTAEGGWFGRARQRETRRRAPVSARRWLTDMLLIAGGVVSLVFEPLAIAIHSIVGLIFVGTVGPHLGNRRAWIRAAMDRIRQRRRMPPKM